jgi:hypothetical protein
MVDTEKLLRRPGVERVDLGWKERGGRLTARMAVKIYVAEKRPNVDAQDEIPRWAKVLVPVGRGMYKTVRVPTDVVWHASPYFCAADDFVDPVLGGVSVGVPGQQAGTYTCRVTDTAGDEFAMTAGHVVQGFQGKVVAGLQLQQPPNPAAVIPPGSSSLLGTTADGFFGDVTDGFLDFALIEIDAGRHASTDSLDGGTVKLQTVSAATVVNDRVSVTKMGAATGRTEAAFSTVVKSITIQGVTVRNVLEFKGVPGPVFGASGDSGALVTSTSSSSLGLIVGILVAATSPTFDAPAGRGFVVPFERLPGVRPS